jgi:hypothetical protein
MRSALFSLLVSCVVAHDAASEAAFTSRFLSLPSTVAPGQPEQFWLALGSTPDAMTVSWLTSSTGDSTVNYGVGGSLSQTATGTSSTYSTLGYTSGSIHIVKLTGLTLGASYSYRVGGANSGWSSVMTFNAPKGVGAIYPFKVAAIGDPGQTADTQSTFAHVGSSGADVAIITGDHSYANGDQPLWDSYQRLTQNVTQFLPTLVVMGNHGAGCSGAPTGPDRC